MKVLIMVLVLMSMVFGGGIYDITTGKWTDTSTNLPKEKYDKADFEVSVGYYGLYAEGYGMNGFVFGMGGKGTTIWGGADIGVGFYKESFDLLTVKVDRRGTPLLDTTTIIVKVLSVNPVVYIGTPSIKCGVGLVFLKGEAAADIGFSTGFKLSPPTKTLVSPFLSTEFTRAQECSYFGLKLGLSIKS